MIILLVQAEKQILYLHFDAKPRTFEVWTTGQCFSCSFTKTRRSRGQISSVVDTFWLVLTYDLFEDRRIDDVVVKTFFSPVYFNSFLYKTNWFRVTVLLFSNRSQRTSKCGKNISDALGCASCATSLFLPHFDVICDPLLNRRTATWNLFVK